MREMSPSSATILIQVLKQGSEDLFVPYLEGSKYVDKEATHLSDALAGLVRDPRFCNKIARYSSILVWTAYVLTADRRGSYAWRCCISKQVLVRYYQANARHSRRVDGKGYRSVVYPAIVISNPVLVVACI